MGIKAINALAKAIKTQTVQYDFGFGTVQEFHCDIPFLVFSEGKSMLPVSFLLNRLWAQNMYFLSV